MESTENKNITEAELMLSQTLWFTPVSKGAQCNAIGGVKNETHNNIFKLMYS